MEKLTEFITSWQNKLRVEGANALPDLYGIPGVDILQICLVLITLAIAASAQPSIDRLKFPKTPRLELVMRRTSLTLPWLAGLIIAQVFLHIVELRAIYVEVAIIIAAGWSLSKSLILFDITRQRRRTLSFIMWAVLALLMTDKLGNIISFLDKAQLELGSVSLSLWSILKASAVFAVLVWAFSNGSKLLERHLARNGTPAVMRTLISKLMGIGGIVLAFLVSLDVIGVDLAALTVFGGALGIGIGFGLRTITSNLMSGLILLTDKSIKPGDVISVGESYGLITAMHARYIVMRKRDGTEVLIPNENLMISEVINWSYNNKNIRQDLMVGVSYNSDMEQVQKILMGIAKEHPRVLEKPAPRCFIKEFGDSSVVFLLRYWMMDPEEGTNNLRGELNMLIWKAFKENNIEIPFPQRVLHQATPHQEAQELVVNAPEAQNTPGAKTE